MIILLIKRLFHDARVLCPCVLCVLLALPVSDARADYTAGTPGGAGKVATDPETGDRTVEVTAPPPAAQDGQQIPVYVSPQAERPWPHPPSPGPKPPRPRQPAPRR
ncbi:MAG: hypothetical protein LBC79_07070 [Deltaproteobacteria bacterium]|jgi:hypothetical protein|nr:hypothetical protein [Deltaproteobacteria bacterium]